MKTIHGFTLQYIFDQAHLDKLGFSFDQFSEAPVETLASASQGDAIDILRSGHRPLLPAQVAIRRTLEAGWIEDGTPAPHRVRTTVRFQRAVVNVMKGMTS